ncbi:MAG: hypothetical protein K2P87_00135 [Lachnospiraceae bacterium]|nr:hypothetical protein [Lachnospiraceae bacterium]
MAENITEHGKIMMETQRLVLREMVESPTKVTGAGYRPYANSALEKLRE